MLTGAPLSASDAAMKYNQVTRPANLVSSKTDFASGIALMNQQPHAAV